jgi:hypothetical protein
MHPIAPLHVHGNSRDRPRVGIEPAHPTLLSVTVLRWPCQLSELRLRAYVCRESPHRSLLSGTSLAKLKSIGQRAVSPVLTGCADIPYQGSG